MLQANLPPQGFDDLAAAQGLARGREVDYALHVITRIQQAVSDSLNETFVQYVYTNTYRSVACTCAAVRNGRSGEAGPSKPCTSCRCKALALMPPNPRSTAVHSKSSGGIGSIDIIYVEVRLEDRVVVAL